MFTTKMTYQQAKRLCSKIASNGDGYTCNSPVCATSTRISAYWDKKTGEMKISSNCVSDENLVKEYKYMEKFTWIRI